MIKDVIKSVCPEHFLAFLRRVRHSPEELFHRLIYERPSPKFRKNLIRKYKHDYFFIQCATRLDDDGVVILPNYFNDSVLEGAVSDFNLYCQAITPNEKKEYRLDRQYMTKSRSLGAMAADSFLTDLIRFSWGKRIYLSESNGYRIDPLATTDYSSFQWHHDNKRKQIKMMILLTDVAPTGQRMDYLPRTQKLWHRHFSSAETRFSNGEITRYGSPPMPCCGPAGTVILFNTNGIHRGNRNLTETRDIWVHCYTAGRSIFPIAGFHSDLYSNLSKDQKNLLRS